MCESAPRGVRTESDSKSAMLLWQLSPLSHTVLELNGLAATGQPRTASIKAFGQALRILGAGNAWLSVLYCSASDIIDGKVCFQTLCDVITLWKSSGVLNWGEKCQGPFLGLKKNNSEVDVEVEIWWKYLPQSTKTEHPFQKWMLSSYFSWDNCIPPTSGSLGTSSCHLPFLPCFPVPLQCGVRHLHFPSYTQLLLIVRSY